MRNKEHIDAFRTEALMILRFQLAFDRIKEFKKFKTQSRSEFSDQLISLKTIENDLVMRICKFDDKGRNTHCFKNLDLSICENNKKIKDEISKFSDLIQNIKQDRRHNQLAHLKKGSEDNQYEPKYNLKPAIRLIIEIIDLVNITPINYEWSDGSYEKYDLKKEVL